MVGLNFKTVQFGFPGVDGHIIVGNAQVGINLLINPLSEKHVCIQHGTFLQPL